MKVILLTLSHLAAGAAGFALGIYALPLLTAPDSPSAAAVESVAVGAEYTGRFRRDLKDSDFLHWGEGDVMIGPQAVALRGDLAPGPDYKLYLSPEFVETEAEFQAVKNRSVRLGNVETFTNFIVSVPESVDISRYDTVVIWCESFSQFITAARYR